MDADPTWPTDLAGCHQLLGDQASMLAEVTHTCEQLQQELEILKRFVYGRRRERVVDDPHQQRLFDEPEDDPPSPADDPTGATETITYSRRRRGGWAPLPADLPRREEVIDLPEGERTCGCCGEPMGVIGEDRSERLAFVPAQVYVRVLVIRKRACGKCRAGVVQPSPPPSPVSGGRYDFGVVAQVVTSKIADHLPLYRQQDVFARAGIEMSRSTLCDIMSGAATLLGPLFDRMKARLLASDLLGADETPVRLLDPDAPGGSRLARFWLYRGFTEAPYDVFDFCESRSRDGPATFLDTFSGVVKVDAYGVQDGVYLGSAGRIRASCCWAHARRKFYDARGNDVHRAHRALAWIAQLYDIEDRAREFSPADRAALRQLEAPPILAAMKSWLDAELPRVLPKSAIGAAMRYAVNQWEALIRYVQDGRQPIDNNDTERDLRRLTIGRNNWLFIGSPEAGPRAAVLYTIVASAARHELEVWSYLDAVMRELTGPCDLDALLPDRWKAAHPEHVRVYRQRERERKASEKRKRRRRRRSLHAARQTRH